MDGMDVINVKDAWESMCLQMRVALHVIITILNKHSSNDAHKTGK